MKLEIVTFLLHSLDAVVKHYLSSSGFDTSDPRVLRLVSLAAQKFVSDVANDALQHCKMRNAGKHILLEFFVKLNVYLLYAFFRQIKSFRRFHLA